MLILVMHKFKVGDIIRVNDDPRDKAVEQKSYGFYKVTATPDKGYDLYSIFAKENYDFIHLWNQWKGSRMDYMSLVKAGNASDFPCHIEKHDSVKEWIEDGYRLATEAEIALYVPKV